MITTQSTTDADVLTRDGIRPIFQTRHSYDPQAVEHDGRRHYPVVYAEAGKSGTTCRLYCPWCDRWHQHGFGPGHREAHCLALDSPYRTTGYIIEVVAKAPLPRVRYKLLLPRGRDDTYMSGRIAAERRMQGEPGRS